MIDLHSHFLFGIDDGARSIQDSMALISKSVEQGVHTIIATPHINPGTFDNDIETIRNAFLTVCRSVDEASISVTLGYAAELRISPQILSLANTGQLPFLGTFKKSQVILLEFPHSHVPVGSEKLVMWLLKQNILPVIAHPERNRDAWYKPDIFDQFLKLGCLMQLTAGSILGDFGSLPQKLSMYYIESACEQLIVASDMHDLSKRGPKLAQAKQYLMNKLYADQVSGMFKVLPEKIITGNSTLTHF